MDELQALKCIFENNMKHHFEEDCLVYCISVRENYFEFICRKEYPNTPPDVFSNIERDVLDWSLSQAQKYLSTPMIFDIIRLVFQKLDESSIIVDTGKLVISYDINDNERITEQDFLAWKQKIIRPKIEKTSMTGKEIFIERKRNKEEINDDI
ncbi:hypothetical protein CWI42_100560 [Ordospora colligata]|uniref:RWD domain-containing protein n=1 Tax=Ordospora colligata OC4 TaxID=1354746 RepID=A0A0B2UI82_9MICR|nr:uncharacterized protein M896_100570 [Ordospora colligata OC4]KHN69073.1 hypothetical protein M896_100570 [Ordospora colligata OC4]TBU14354.1 hypothetical protein CWI40_100580 [Ordospora colligata]TBU14419.1 hypothetical protein CWI41_100580 [Ordospora colligata]TBU17935.1 hypothetical protein CWI42_100560 [Ordospora colligata]